MGRFLKVSIPVAKWLRKAGALPPKKEDGSSLPPSEMKKASITVAKQVIGDIQITDKLVSASSSSAVRLGDLNSVSTQKSKDKTFVGGLLEDLFGNVKEGLGSGIKNAGQTLIDKITGKVIGSNGVQGAQDSISDYASGIMESSIAKYMKRNWFYILFPIIGILVFAKFLFNGKRSNRRKRKY